MADGVAVPAWIRVLRQGTTIRPDDAPSLLEHVEDEHLVRRLDDLKGTQLVEHLARKSPRVAYRGKRIVDIGLVHRTGAVARLVAPRLLLPPLCPRSALMAGAGDASTARIPDAADIAPRRGSRIGLGRIHGGI